MRFPLRVALIVAALFGPATAARADDAAPETILNASYDIARELFEALNPPFAAQWQKSSGKPLEIKQSHAGSSKQARAILEGLPADVVTFNQVTDIQALVDKGFVRQDWQQAFPNAASPYYSLPAFAVRKGNPKNIHNWDDLARADVKVIMANPKTSGNGRYAYLAAYAFARDLYKGDDAKAQEFIGKVVSNVPVFDTGGRGATTTFTERSTGDVLVTFESEVNSLVKEFGADKYEKVVPPSSLLAEFPVAVVDKVAEKRGSKAIVTAYLNYLYAPEAQEILASFAYRVRNTDIAARHAADFPPVKLYTIDSFGGWEQAQKVHFASGGTFDQVFEKK